MLEKYNLCVVGTVDPAQHFHFIAMALTSNENEATHAYIFGLVRDEINALLAAKTALQERI